MWIPAVEPSPGDVMPMFTSWYVNDVFCTDANGKWPKSNEVENLRKGILIALNNIQFNLNSIGDPNNYEKLSQEILKIFMEDVKESLYLGSKTTTEVNYNL